MQFTRIIGKIDKKLIQAAEEILTKVALELGTKVDNDIYGTNLGGDPLIFALVVPAEHVATLNIPTAATDGRRFYWNPKWLCSRNLLGARLTFYHEAGHALYLHPQRRGSRIARLWNIAVDYIVNGMIMEDLKVRLKTDVRVHQAFTSGFGNYLTLEQCKQMFTNPFEPIKGFENFVPEPVDPDKPVVSLPAPDDDRELTEAEKKEIENRNKVFKFYYADPNLPEDMKRPERIYDVLFALLPKCPECGAVGKYPIPEQKSGKGKSSNGKSNQTDDKEKSEKQSKQHPSKDNDDHHDHCSHDSSDNDGKGSEGNQSSDSGQDSGQPGQQSSSCSTCGGWYDVLDSGSTVDEHIDSVEDPDKLAKKMSDAIKAARQMAGRVPQGLEDELGVLSAPRIKWQDFIRTKLVRVRSGNARNDWSKFRIRPMFAGLMIPKKTNCIAKFGCLLDTSGSMSTEDMAFGVSQLSSLDERSEGVIVPADAQIYWDQATKIKSANKEELAKVKIIGRGGTKYAEFFRDYEKKIGKMDFLVMITDGLLDPSDINEMVDPGIDVIWVITSSSLFKAPFGRVFDLKGDLSQAPFANFSKLQSLTFAAE